MFVDSINVGLHIHPETSFAKSAQKAKKLYPHSFDPYYRNICIEALKNVSFKLSGLIFSN